MVRQTQHYTSTMARIYAGQGYLRKAAQIYRYLLEKDPTRADWKDALAALEKRIAGQRAPNRKELGLLMSDWINMMKTYKQSKSPDAVGIRKASDD